MDAKEKKIIRRTIKELGKLWQLEDYQVVRRLGRIISNQESINIIKKLYEAIKEDN